MKKICFIIISISVFGLTLCTKENENAMVGNPENEALVQKYLNAIVTGDTNAIGGFMSENFVSHGPGINDSANFSSTVAEYKKNWKAWSSIDFDRYIMLSHTVKEGRLAGDWVMDWARITVHYKNKSTVTINWHGVYKVENGKIVEEDVFYDVADILRQQGYTFVPPVDSTKTSQ